MGQNFRCDVVGKKDRRGFIYFFIHFFVINSDLLSVISLEKEEEKDRK